MSSVKERYDVVVAGGGHNGLVAAAYLGRAGLSVLVLERRDRVGGGTACSPVVGIPERIRADLELDISLRDPVWAADSVTTDQSSHPEQDAWRELRADLADVAHAIRPTLLEPLPLERDVRDRVDPGLWRDFVTQPLGVTLEERFNDDALRGAIGAAGLLDTFSSLQDPSLAANRTFLYRHVLAGGVPEGGPAALEKTLEKAARDAGVEIVTGAGVSEIGGGTDSATASWHDGEQVHTVTAGHVLASVAPWILQILLGSPDDPETKPAGSSLMVRLELDGRPDGVPDVFPVASGLAALETAYGEAAAGSLPSAIPGEARWAAAGNGRWELTFTGLHTPAALFSDDADAIKQEAVHRVIASLDKAVATRVTDVLEVRSPLDVEADLAMPGGHAWHGDLDWPWASNRALLDTPARAWGVQTDVPTVLVCGSGARRGGGVTGLGGHNAAHAVLDSRGG